MLELKRIEKSYALGNAAVSALKGVSLSVSPGEAVALVGPSGSGKSTVLNVAGLIDDPSAGEVWFSGQRLDTLNEERRTEFRRDTFGYVFQSFHLVPVLTVIENVLLPLRLQRRNAATAQSLAEERLREVGLADFAYRSVQSLSGGQRQRVAIARALVHRPKLVLADEPTAHLDQRNSEEALELLYGLCREHRSALLLVTHDEAEMRRATRVVVLRDGVTV